MAGDQSYQSFGQILNCFLSKDNDERSKAEEMYSNISSEQKILYLLNIFGDAGVDESIKHLGCVLMRRLITNQFAQFYPNLSVEDQDQLKQRLLMCVQGNMDEYLTKKMCDVVAELARNLIDEQGNNAWPQFLQFLFQCSGSDVPLMKECALRIFTVVPGIFGNQEKQHLPMIKGMLGQSIMCKNNPQVQAHAVRAFCSYLILHEKDTSIQKGFQDLLPNVIQVLETNIWVTGDEDNILKSFIDLCESSPKFIRQHLPLLIPVCLRAVSNKDLDDEIRHLSLEILITLCETAPVMMKKSASTFVEPLVIYLLDMMTDLDDDPQWSIQDEVVDQDNESNDVVGESSIDRLACSLGGKTVLPCIVKHIPQMFNSADWKCRHAALMAISAIGEGCNKHMEALLPQIMDGVLPYLQDEHPRVRYAACNAIGQMSSDFPPTVQKNFHAKIVPSLLALLDDNENIRVQSHAGAALVNFVEDCPKIILVHYLDTMMAKLQGVLNTKFTELLEKGNKLVLEQVVTTIAAIADTAEEQFVHFYDGLVPQLKYIIQHAESNDLKPLRGKALECISLIGLAVGSAKFSQDAKCVMDILLKSYQQNGENAATTTTTISSSSNLFDMTAAITETEDSTRAEIAAITEDAYNTYLISAWGRICMVLGKDFQPYLPLVMGPVMKTASIKPEVALFDNDDIQDMDKDDVDWQFVSLGEQQNFGIRTAGLEEKFAACEMLVCYARELKECFSDYAEQVVRLMVPLLKFYFHDGVRTSAAQSLPFLLQCVKGKGPAYVNDMWQFICPQLLAAIKADPENEVIGDMFLALGKCVQTLGKDWLKPEWMAELLSLVHKSIEEHFTEEQQGNGEDAEDRDDEDDDDDVESPTLYKISKISDLVHCMFSAYGVDFLPHFDQLLPLFVEMLQEKRKWQDHQWGICAFDDMIEFVGPHCAKYQNCFLPAFATYMKSKHCELRQASYYGIGVLAMCGGEAFAEACAKLMPDLIKGINDPAAKTEENSLATENAISAVTKILRYNSSRVNVDEILPYWFQWLPVTEDTDEVAYVMGYLCDLVEARNAFVLANIPKVSSILLQVFVANAIKLDHPVAKHMVDILRRISASQETFDSCVQHLTAIQLAKFREISEGNFPCK